MSDETTTVEAPEQGLKVSVTFDRKVSDGDYGSIEARAWVESEVPRGASPAEVGAALQDAFAAAKVVVLDELGIPFVMDPETGIVREKNVPTVGMHVNPAQAVESQMGPKTTSVKIMNKDQQGHVIPPDVVEQIVAAGVTAVWVNDGYYREALSKSDREAGKKARTFS